MPARKKGATLTTREAAAILRMGRSRFVALSERDDALKVCRRWIGRGWKWDEEAVYAYRDAQPCERVAS